MFLKKYKKIKLNVDIKLLVGVIPYETRVRFRIWMQVRVQMQDSAIFEKLGACASGCGD